MYQQTDLSKDLSSEEFTRTLSLIGLGNQETYTEDDADIFFKCRELINQGKSDEEILQVLSDVIKPLNLETDTSKNQNTNEKPAETKKRGLKPKTISNLLAIASKRTNLEISLIQVIDVLNACGLDSSSPSYSPQECDRFLEAADLVLVKKQPLSEVAAHFDTNLNEQKSDEFKLDQVVEDISNKAVQARDQLTNLVDRITAMEASEVPNLVNELYLKNVLLQLQSSSSESNVFAQLEERIIKRIEGKKSQPRQTVTLTMEEMKQLPSSSEKLMKLPPELESGTNTD